MAGHSKWANIQHRKKAQDAKRGRLFTKLIREIAVAAKLGGGQLDGNPRLRLAVDKALEANVGKTNIDRAIKRACGAGDGGDYQSVTYEGYAAGGIAVLVECMTDNKNRTVAEVRNAFVRHDGKLGTSGSVARLFSQKGVLVYSPECDEDGIISAMLDAGAEDMVTCDDGIWVLTEPPDLFGVREAMEKAGFVAQRCEYQMYPSASVVPDKGDALKALRLLEVLDNCEDVQNVYCNADFSSDVVAGAG